MGQAIGLGKLTAVPSRNVLKNKDLNTSSAIGLPTEQIQK